MTSWHADRLSQLPPYLFVETDRKKRAAKEAGRDVIDFGVGDPDCPTPDFVMDRMVEAIRVPENHRYPLGVGSKAFRQAAASYMAKRFRVQLDPATEVLALIGSKEGIGHLPTAVLNPGQVALVPEPGYPVYQSGTLFAGGESRMVPLRPENNWLPELDAIPNDVVRRARLLYLCYPNNPTAACATPEFLERAVAFARQHNLLVAYDAAYAEVFFDEEPLSILQIDGARENCVEFHSLSKTFNMTGWRVAFAVGNADALAALAKVKSNVDSGVFTAVQDAGVVALNRFDGPEVRAQVEVYRRRRDVLIAGLREAGWDADAPKATFFAWIRCPKGWDSMRIANRLLDEANVVVVPGAGFGEYGKGFVRFALTVDEDRTREAVARIVKLDW